MSANYDSTIKRKIEARLKGLDTTNAQAQLEEWCHEFGLKPWKIDAKQADWRELCYRLLGLPPSKTEAKKKGRPSHDEGFEQEVIFALADHTFLAISKEEKLKGASLYEQVAKEVGLQRQLKTTHADGGNAKDEDFTNPSAILRGIDQRYDKKQQKRRLKKEQGEVE